MNIPKIIVTGAESTGKTTLAQELSRAVGYGYLAEYSRSYLSALDRPYVYEDLLRIAQGQLRSEVEAMHQTRIGLICDTSLIVMKVWSLYKYGEVDPWIVESIERQDWTAFILPHWDIPYEEDPLRENPDERHLLYELYLAELEEMAVPYQVVTGSVGERLTQAVDFVRAL